MPIAQINEALSLYFRLIQGDQDKPVLVFLHEGLGCDAMLKDFPDLLCKATGFPGLVYDRQGYGKSSPLNHTRTIDYLHDYSLKELPELLNAAIPGRPFILIGHSDGGSISLIYGAQRPPLLKGIITEAAHVFVEPETIAGIIDAVEAWEKGLLTGLSKYHGDKTETIFKAWSVTWLADWFQGWNIEYLLPDIHAPLLVIQGADDQYASIEQVNSIVSKTSGKAQMEMVENCKHAPHFEAQEVVLELMSEFIAQLE